MQVNSPEYRALVSSLLGKQVIFEDIPKIKTSPISNLPKNKPLLTGIRDVNLKILQELDDEELFSFCIVNKEANKLCENEDFWRNRFLKRFGKLYAKDEKRTWKNFYLTILKDFGKEVFPEMLDKDINRLIKSVTSNRFDGKMYETHDNGGRPFLVFVNDTNNNVLVYKQENAEHSHSASEDDEPTYSRFPNFIFLNSAKVFVGISPENEMTKFSGGYGPKFDGNSILVNTEHNNYVYIGSEIYSFKSLSKIVEYISPVGNNDVPYPYAIDIEGNIYLMLEKVILLDGKFRVKQEDPSRYYYQMLNMKGYAPFEKYYVERDEEPRLLSYNPEPEKRLQGLKKEGRIYIMDGKKKKYIADEEFINIMRNYEEKMGLKPMKVFQLQKRMF